MGSYGLVAARFGCCCGFLFDGCVWCMLLLNVYYHAVGGVYCALRVFCCCGDCFV